MHKPDRRECTLVHELDQLARAARKAVAEADAAGELDKDAVKVLLDVQKREEVPYGSPPRRRPKSQSHRATASSTI